MAAINVMRMTWFQLDHHLTKTRLLMIKTPQRLQLQQKRIIFIDVANI